MLNDSQLQAFRAALFAETDPELVTHRTNGSTPMIVQWYNQPRTPDFIVWKTLVTQDEIMMNGFDWVRVDNLSVGKARIWEWLFGNEQRVINPSKPNVRAGIAEVWKGTAADLAVQAVVLGHCKRPATRIEHLFATGTGTIASPGDLVLVDQLSDYDVDRVLSMPRP